MITSYENKNAVITGAANGIGKALALGMAKRGANILVVDIHEDEAEQVAEEIRGMGSKAYSFGADVSTSSECDEIFKYALEVFDEVDILVNDAGVSMNENVTNFKDEDLAWIFETNVFSHWYMLRNFLPYFMKLDKHVQILNVCSIAGLVTSGPGPAYFATKHAAVSLSESVWKQLYEAGNDKIDISVFCPGFIQTKMYEGDRHRPARHAIDPEDPYYKTEEYQKYYRFNKYLLDNGKPLDETIEQVFEQLGKKQFYILTHDQYDPILRDQGNWVANKKEPQHEALAVRPQK